MAGYDATINVRVTGGNSLDAVITRTTQLQKLVTSINTTSLDLSKPFGRGKAADEFGKAAKVLNDLKREFINSTSSIETFGTASNRSISNIRAVSGALDELANNVKIGSDQFREFTVAAEQAALAAGVAQRKRLEVLSQELSFAGKGKTIKGSGSLVQELLAQEKQIPNTRAALESYRADLINVQNIVDMTSKEFIELEAAINRVNVAMGKGPLQGPALPPGSSKKGGRPTATPAPTKGKSKLGRLSSFGVGVGFPLLFGAGPGQIIGGGIGTALAEGLGLASQEAMGLQIGTSALGGVVEKLIRDLAVAGNALKTLDMEPLRNSTIYVNAELETTVRRLKEAGNTVKAQEIAAQAVANQTGITTTQVQEGTDAVNRLNNAWNELVSLASGYSLVIAGPIIDALIVILKTTKDILKEAYKVGPSFKDWYLYLNPITGPIMFIKDKLKEQVKEISNGTEELEKRNAALTESNDRLATEVSNSKAIYELESQRRIATSFADKEHNAALDYRIKQTQIQQQYDKDILEFNLKSAGLSAEEVTRGKDLLVQKRDLAFLEAERVDKVARATLELERQRQIHSDMVASMQNENTLLSDKAQILTYNSQMKANDFSLAQARLKAESDLLGLEVERLKRLREQTDSVEHKLRATIYIYDRLRAQAKLEYESQLLSLRNSVAQAKSDREQVRIKEQQLRIQIEILIAQAQGIQNEEARAAAVARAYQLQRSSLSVVEAMSKAADKALRTSYEIAQYELQSAKYAYVNKVEALNYAEANEKNAIVTNAAKKNTEAMAAAAGDYARSMERGATAASRWSNFGLSPAGSTPAYGSGGYITQPHMGIVGESGPEYIVPESKAAAFATNYMAGARGAAAMRGYAEGGSVGPVNITTGPVMQQDGTRYVTLADMEKAFETYNASVSRSMRTYGGRSYQGIG